MYRAAFHVDFCGILAHWRAPPDYRHSRIEEGPIISGNATNSPARVGFEGARSPLDFGGAGVVRTGLFSVISTKKNQRSSPTDLAVCAFKILRLVHFHGRDTEGVLSVCQGLNKKEKSCANPADLGARRGTAAGGVRVPSTVRRLRVGRRRSRVALRVRPTIERLSPCFHVANFRKFLNFVDIVSVTGKCGAAGR